MNGLYHTLLCQGYLVCICFYPFMSSSLTNKLRLYWRQLHILVFPGTEVLVKPIPGARPPLHPTCSAPRPTRRLHTIASTLSDMIRASRTRMSARPSQSGRGAGRRAGRRRRPLGAAQAQ